MTLGTYGTARQVTHAVDVSSRSGSIECGVCETTAVDADTDERGPPSVAPLRARCDGVKGAISTTCAVGDARER